MDGLGRAFGRERPRVVKPGTGAAGPLSPPPSRPPPTLQPDPELPEVPEPVTAPVSIYETRPINEPKRQSGRKARRRKDWEADITRQLGDQGIWPYSVFSDRFTTMEKIRQTVAMGGLQTAMTRAGMRVPVHVRDGMQRPSAPPGSRSTQRGAVSLSGLKPQGTVEPFQELMQRQFRPGGRSDFERLLDQPLRPAPAKPARVQPVTSPHQPAPVRAPASMPGGVSPPPATPGAPSVTSSTAGTGLDPAQPVRPGPRPATATPGTGGLPGTAAGSAPRAPSASPGTVARPAAGAARLPADALLGYPLGFLLSRSSDLGKAPRSARAADPAPAGRPRTSVPTLTSPAGSPPGDTRCTCTKSGKPRKPRKPRTTCYVGTYTETATGLRKVRREQVPC